MRPRKSLFRSKVMQRTSFSKIFSLNLFVMDPSRWRRSNVRFLPHGLFIQKYQENALCMSGNKTLIAYINNSLEANTPIVLSLEKCHYSKALFGGCITAGPTGICRAKARKWNVRNGRNKSRPDPIKIFSA